ncbi:MAG: T9SS type A sorting domain-containing protein, partial [Cyclobacteriaceae bacterium]
NDAGNRIFSTEKTYIADGGGAGTSAVFVVMKLTMDGDNTNGNDVFQLFTSTSFPIEEPATWDLTTTTGADIDVNSVFLREKMDFNGGPQDHNFDFNDMRVADSWDALFPTTTYAGSAWSSGNPNSSTSAKVNSNLSLASDLVVNNLEISAGVSVTIAAGQTLDVKGNISGSGNLVVESGGSLLVYDGNTLGSVTVKRNSSFEDAANRYSFIGSPVAGFDIAGLNSGFHYTYNTSDDTYTAASGVMTPGVGYTSAGKKALEFVGTPNVGTINVTLDNTGDQFNFISNPYTSAISRSSFVTANSNIDGSIYLWDDGGSNVGKRTNADFITVTNAGATGGSNGSGATFDENTAIGSAQGFLVKGSAAGDVTFTEAMRVMDNNADGNFFRLDNELYKFKLNVAGSGNHDQTLIAFTNQATDGFDRSWDATKMLLGGSLGLYTKMEESKLAVQALPLIEGSIDILLGLQVMHDDAYVLSLEDVNIPTSYTITLIDNKTNEIVNLIDGEVTLSLSSSDQDRFTLRVSSVSDVLSIDDLSKRLKAYMSENQLNIESPSIKGEAFLTVFDFGGRIYTKSNVSFDENGRSNINAAFLKSGIYIVKIQKGKSIQTTKIIINN